jgi:hypothetical protein
LEGRIRYLLSGGSGRIRFLVDSLVLATGRLLVTAGVFRAPDMKSWFEAQEAIATTTTVERGDPLRHRFVFPKRSLEVH